jgi:hypothetical protein
LSNTSAERNYDEQRQQNGRFSDGYHFTLLLPQEIKAFSRDCAPSAAAET